jgi:hypothetical protein
LGFVVAGFGEGTADFGVTVAEVSELESAAAFGVSVGAFVEDALAGGFLATTEVGFVAPLNAEPSAVAFVAESPEVTFCPTVFKT